MLLEAQQRGALDEVLVIASALSVQDVRDRPLDKQAQADQAHAKFDDEKSEFSGTLKLWKWLEDSKGGHGTDHKLSHRQYENLLRENFINVRRVREWRDIHTQLHTVVAEHKWRSTRRPRSYEQLHLSMLAGLLGNIGQKNEAEDWYLGARGIKFYRHPGANLSKKPGRWIVCAELVETTRLFGRGIASHRAAVAGAGGRAPAQEAAAGPALGEEGSAGHGAGTRHAVWPGGLSQPPHRLRPGGPGGRARDLHPRGAGGRRMGNAPAVSGRQPEAGETGRRSWSTSRAGKTCWWTTS